MCVCPWYVCLSLERFFIASSVLSLLTAQQQGTKFPATQSGTKACIHVVCCICPLHSKQLQLQPDQYLTVSLWSSLAPAPPPLATEISSCGPPPSHLPSPPLPSPCLYQVDGPSHFVLLPGGGRRPNGATLLKRRLLGRAGLRVVSVPYWEWRTCAGPAEQAAYLRRLLLESR